MEVWDYFIKKLTLESSKGTKGLKYDDAYLCCRVAELEGEMDMLLKHGGTASNQWTQITATDKQGRLRDLFKSKFPNDELLPKLQPGYKPKGSMD